MNEKSSPPLPLPPPESFYVFVVGHCEEWPENRHDEGDTAIYNEYLDFGVPADQCVYIKDDDCTRENCQKTLEAFLDRITPSSSSSPQERPNENGNSNPGETLAIPKTLVFFYGGHGVANGFSTIGGTWSHRQIAQTIEALFHGDRVLFLLDCCASGNLWRHIPSPSSLTKKTTQKHYVLLGTSQPYLVHSFEDGDDEWILSNTWIQLMRHLRATGGGSEDYLGLEKMISLESDRHMFQEASLFFAYISKPSSCAPNSTMSGDAWSWMPAGCRQREQSNETSSNSVPSVPEWLPSPNSKSVSDKLKEMPNEAKILSAFDCRVGGAIVYKHPGGYPKSLREYGSTLSSSSAKPEEPLSFYVPPLWLNGTIVAIFENRSDYSDVFLRIRVWYPSQNEPWEVDISHRSPRLINHLYVTFNWMLPSKFLKTQVMLAKKYQQYLDCSMVANTPVRVALGDADDDDADASTFLEGTILDWKDFHWKHLLRACTSTSWVTTKYDDFYWNELPVPAKAAAEALGYTKSSWDKDTGIPADNMEWEELSTVQKDAASFLGYSREKPKVSPSVNSNSWKNLAEISTCSGPHVPVEWENNQSSLVPLKQIVVPRGGSRNANLSINWNSMTAPESSNTTEISDDETRLDHLQRQSLIRGLKSSGKSITNARLLLNTAELTAFWVEDETWWDAVPIDIPCQDESSICAHKELSLDLLATHFEYTLPGVYCPVEYADGVKHLIPLNYIYRRGCQPQQEEEETGTDADTDADADADLGSETETRTRDAIQALEQELQHLRERVEASDQKKAELTTTIETLEDKNADLTKQLDDTSTSLTSNLNLSIIEFLAGFLGWSPILPFNVCCGDDNRKLIDGRDPSGCIESIWLHIRIPFFVFSSILDLADAILDIVVATLGILQGSGDGASLPGWALWLFIMTLLARALGGCFAVVYDSIPESDRELTYFLVEMTIFIMEDLASIFYIILLLQEPGPWEVTNICLSMLCALLFAVPTLCRYRTFTKEFPCYASSFLLGFYLLGTLWFLFLLVFGLILPALGINEPIEWVFDRDFLEEIENLEILIRSFYIGPLLVQFFFLYHWIQHLIKKERKSREEQHCDSDSGQQGHSSLVLASQEISV